MGRARVEREHRAERREGLLGAGGPSLGKQGLKVQLVPDVSRACWALPKTV